MTNSRFTGRESSKIFPSNYPMRLHKTFPPYLALLLLLFITTPTPSQNSNYISTYNLPYSQATPFLRPHGLKNFSLTTRKALDVYLWAEDYYKQGKYRKSKALLDRLWSEHPPGSTHWDRAYYDAKKINIGRPAVYSSLRMLTVCVNFRVKQPLRLRPVRPNARLTVLLPAYTKGIRPRNRSELRRKTGVLVTNSLAPEIRRNNFRSVRLMAWLFTEYITAATKGRLTATVRILDLKNLTLPVGFWKSSYGGHKLEYAGLKDDWLNTLWKAVPPDAKKNTDWWWLIHPSHFPEKRSDINQINFITGGMGGVPGGAPLFISDDLTHVRKRPFQGGQALHEIEHRTYFPQWFQHEFFHHIFGKYKNFGLEKKGHDWFKRSTWPRDFRGKYEADYFHEALFKRILPRGKPPLSAAIRYAKAGETNFKSITAESLVGTYRRLPVTNPWHEGRIRLISRNRNGAVLEWRNQAGVKWKLHMKTGKSSLKTGRGNPYYKQGARNFQLRLKKDRHGDYTNTLEGFIFNGELYKKQ